MSVLEQCRAIVLERRRALLLTMLFGTALFFRVVALGAAGFAEDEINKLRAIDAYRRGDFSANAEHPMLMKLAAWGSLALAERWNRIAPGARWTISPEAAVRLPNAVGGAATAVVIFLVGELLFDGPTAALAAALWALDVNATAVNRILKEDTLLVLFLLLAVWCHLRGRRRGTADPVGAQRWYAASGAALGLMLATKYLPHYFGLHALFRHVAGPREGPGRLRRRWFYPPMVAAFLLANFAIVLPATWRYVAGFLRGETVRHVGYVFAGRLYPNMIDVTPWGLPPWFYLVYFSTKIPLAVLAAAGVGLWQLFRRSQTIEGIFVRTFLVPLLLGYSLVATKFLRYMLPVLAILDLAAAAGIAWAIRRLVRAGRSDAWRSLGAAGLAGFVLASAARAEWRAAPYYGLSQNRLGRAVARGELLFPEDELYDAGLREAVQYVAAWAGPQAIVTSDAPGVVTEYLTRYGRRDVAVWQLSRRGVPLDGRESWVLVQDGRIYFENAALVAWLRDHLAPVRVITIRGVVAVRIYRLGAGPEEGGPGNSSLVRSGGRRVSWGRRARPTAAARSVRERDEAGTGGAGDFGTARCRRCGASW